MSKMLFLLVIVSFIFNFSVLYAEDQKADLNPQFKELPRYETEQEKIFDQKAREEFFKNPPPTYAPPSGTVQMHSEFDPIKGSLMGGQALLSGLWKQIRLEMIEAMQQEPDHIMYLMVENQNYQDWVTDVILDYGLTMDSIEFWHVKTDSTWCRDYGPEYITANGEAGFIDMKYYSIRPNDDLIPSKLAVAWQIDNYEMPLYMEGGNLQSDGCGTCVYTDVVYPNNGGLTQAQVDDMIMEYYGCYQVIVFQRMLDDGGTGHVDMFFKFVDQDNVIVAQATNIGSPDYARLEYNAALIASMNSCNGIPYIVHRMPLVSPYYTYTNSSIVNNTVLVPIYGFSQDAVALAMYESLYTDRTIVGIDCMSVIDMGGAIHCVVMELPEIPEPEVQPIELTFNYYEFTKQITIQNVGIGELNWTMDNTDGCFGFNPSSGDTTTETDTVNVTVAKCLLGVGEHWVLFTVNTTSGDIEIPVHVYVSQAELDNPVSLSDRELSIFGIFLLLVLLTFIASRKCKFSN